MMLMRMTITKTITTTTTMTMMMKFMMMTPTTVLKACSAFFFALAIAQVFRSLNTQGLRVRIPPCNFKKKINSPFLYFY